MRISVITLNGSAFEDVEEFTYLGSLLSKDNAVAKDIKARLGKAHYAFFTLQLIWKSAKFSIRTKIRLFNIKVKSVLVCGSECFSVIKANIKKMQVFHHYCLWRICPLARDDLKHQAI